MEAQRELNRWTQLAAAAQQEAANFQANLALRDQVVQADQARFAADLAERKREADLKLGLERAAQALDLKRINPRRQEAAAGHGRDGELG